MNLDFINYTGLWRLNALYLRTRIKNGRLRARMGSFRITEFASLAQFCYGWERSVCKIVQRNKGLFVDVGANIGVYSVMAALNGNHVIALEPGEKAFRILKQNVQENGIRDRVLIYNMAAWSSEKELFLERSREMGRRRIGPDGDKVFGIRLDQLVGDAIPTLIKIDAEGSEPDILKGMKNIMTRAHPAIIFEALNEAKFRECKEVLFEQYHISKLDRGSFLATWSANPGQSKQSESQYEKQIVLVSAFVIGVCTMIILWAGVL